MLTIGDVLKEVQPRFHRRKKPTWPPDAFALMASIVKRSGIYTRVVQDWKPHGFRDKRSWKAAVCEAGQDWRKDAPRNRWPARIDRWWAEAMRSLGTSIVSLGSDKVAGDAMLSILAAADQACDGMGFWRYASTDLQEEGLERIRESHSLCRHVDPDRVRVLPKLHNPYDGLTLRSLSHHLALWTNREVNAQWQFVDLPSVDAGLNVLLLPWPLKINPSCFAGTPGPTEEDSGYFTYTPPPFAGVDRVRALVHEAEQAVGEVHVLVWPESSLREEEVSDIQQAFPTKMIIAGVTVPPSHGGRYGRNMVAVANPVDEDDAVPPLPVWQSKHHRWRIDKEQVRAYGLGPSFAGYAAMWEAIEIPSRDCNFHNVNSWLTLSVLICEDLARQDPVAELIRSVGPNLLIALLMDGPQLEKRWPARYATIFAEDPRTSVLTLTSAGMVRLSNAQFGTDGDAKVALWRDAVERRTYELTLKSGAEALALTLGSEVLEEKTADGRSDQRATGYVTLHGVHQVYPPAAGGLGGTSHSVPK